MISSEHRPTKAIIDLKAIQENVLAVKEHIPKETQVFAVVKANAYGHGAVEVAHGLKDKVDKFCVSNLDEAIELRKSGIELPILILGVVMPGEIVLAKNYNVTLTVASLDWYNLAKEEGHELSDLKVHLKIDSGMGRIGLRSSQEVNCLISDLTASGVIIEGIFTHFATADEVSDDKFNQQLTTFKKLLSELEDCPTLVHASNSATSLWHSETIFNAVRLGIVIYGLNPSGNLLQLPYTIKPALRLETQLVHVKELSKGDTVGYGATYHVSNQEIVGTLPIGYADGFIRKLQGFHVLVDGQFCDIIGRVSMDQTTVRLPKAYPLGTKVTLIGSDKGNTILTTEMADYLGTINYEVVCLLTDRIPRYYQEESNQ